MAHPLVKLAIVAAAVVGAALAVLVTWMVLRLIARRVLLIKTLTRRMHRPFQTLVVTIALDVGLRASSMAEGHWRRLVVHLADLSVIAASAWLIWAVWPFSRLVHAWSVPLWYLWRPYIVYRSRRALHPAEPGTSGRRWRKIGVPY